MEPRQRARLLYRRSRDVTFTEIAIDMADERLPFCRHTAPPSDAYGMLRVLDGGQPSGRFVALLTFVGPHDVAQEIARDLQRDRSSTQVEVVAQDSTSTTMRVALAVDPHDHAQARLLATVRLFERIGPDHLVEPILFRGGRMRARIIVPRTLENATVHAAVAEAHARGMFRELRLLRVARLEPERHVEVMRPLLTVEQDELLRLAMTMGYYSNPKRATLEHISSRVGLSISPIHKRLKAAEEMLVAAHVGGAARAAMPQPRRRPRRRPMVSSGSGPFEVDLSGRTREHPVGRFTFDNRTARVLLQPIGEDARAGLAHWSLVAVASRAQAEDLQAALEAHPGVVVTVISSEDQHMCARVQAPIERTWSCNAVSDAFNGSATLRRLVFDGAQVFGRFVVVGDAPADEVEGRLVKVAAEMGWDAPEMLSFVDSAASRVPAELPEPLSARQEEVLKVAHALGYYRTPRGCTLEQVASTLGVSANAIHKNLVGAESRIISHYMAAGF